MHTLTSRAVGISTGPDSHLDHLGVLCAILDLPLIVTDEKKLQLANKFYPQCEVRYVEPADLSLEFIASRFDVIFECGKFWSLELLPLLELFFHKKMRLVFCPHGNSDKGHSLTSSSQHTPQDVALVYGKQMVDALTAAGAIENIGQWVRTGNYRFAFYQKHRQFYDNLAQEEVFKTFDKSKKTLLYAPTWADGENPTSFFTYCRQIVEQLSESFNVLIKLHPLLEETHPAETYHILMQYEGQKNVCFLREFPPIFPLLAGCDIYLGDYSSIGYDFLAFDKPLYFINSLTSKEGRFLHQCGQEIPAEAWKNLASFITNSLEENDQSYRELRRQIYEYAFGEEIEWGILKEIIFSTVNLATAKRVSSSQVSLT
jgi:hypothetical protein